MPFRDAYAFMEWMYRDLSCVVAHMEASTREHKFTQQEFEWADCFESACKVSDFSIVLGTLPGWFWIFVIGLIYTFVGIAESLVETWVNAVEEHFGVVAIFLLFVTACITWPYFIVYLCRAFGKASEVVEVYRKTVRIYDLPQSTLRKDLVEWCTDKKVDYVSITFVEEALNEEEMMTPRDSPTKIGEIVFKDFDKLKQAFGSQKDKEQDAFLLYPSMNFRIVGKEVTVRVRPKTLESTASVEWWCLVFKELEHSFDAKRWKLAVISCLLTMPLMKRLTEGFFKLWVMVQSVCGTLGNIFTWLFLFMSLCFVVGQVGWCSFEDIREACKGFQRESPCPPNADDSPGGGDDSSEATSPTAEPTPARPAQAPAPEQPPEDKAPPLERAAA